LIWSVSRISAADWGVILKMIPRPLAMMIERAKDREREAAN
jgi:hypothetical protein